MLLFHVRWLLLYAIVRLPHACSPLCIPLVVRPRSLQLLQPAGKHPTMTEQTGRLCMHNMVLRPALQASDEVSARHNHKPGSLS